MWCIDKWEMITSRSGTRNRSVIHRLLPTSTPTRKTIRGIPRRRLGRSPPGPLCLLLPPFQLKWMQILSLTVNCTKESDHTFFSAIYELKYSLHSSPACMFHHFFLSLDWSGRFHQLSNFCKDQSSETRVIRAPDRQKMEVCQPKRTHPGWFRVHSDHFLWI
ncbi:hypothetical protein KSP39_PZI023208 [Platanthera zijinensis]|uniref:Uncharacterized protein n=1 Tax=Platanthera zijinensis TaxID=2320716 RepID=A0AAP0AVD2_9ASPA